MSELNHQEKVELAKALIKSGEHDGGDLMLLWCDHDNLLNESLSLKEHLRLKEGECIQLAEDKLKLKSLIGGLISEYEELLNKSINHIGSHGTSALSQAKLTLKD